MLSAGLRQKLFKVSDAATVRLASSERNAAVHNFGIDGSGLAS